MTTNASAFVAEHRDLTSEATGRSYRITVEVPNRYPQGEKSYPVIVVLDGQWIYGVVRDAFRIMPLDRELPEAVVVGVAHNTPDFRDLLQERAADFTPTEASAPVGTGVRLPATEVGGAARFRRALLDEILPLVAADYRITDDRTLVGHSFSALFGADTLLTEPGAFNRWVLTSPSVWWDSHVMFRREAEHAARTTDLPGRVFMSTGSDEGGGELFGGHRPFYEQLAGRDYPSLDLSWREFEGETHQTVIGVSVSRGLRTVFRPAET